MSNSPIATLSGFPFFYAIPIDGHVREIPSEPRIWKEGMEQSLEEDNILLCYYPPRYSKTPQRSVSGPLPILEELDESLSMIHPYYLPVVVPDGNVITAKTGRAKTDPITKGRTLRRRIRYPSLPIGRWAQSHSSSKDDNVANEINGNGKPLPPTPEHKRSFRFPSISARTSWSSFRPSPSSPLSATMNASTTSFHLERVTEMPPELEAIEAVSPISFLSELDSTPVTISELSSETSQQSTLSMQLPDQTSSTPLELQSASVMEDEDESCFILPDRELYRSWYIDDDAEGLSVPPRINEFEDSDPPPRHSEDISPPPHSFSPSPSPVPSLISDTTSTTSSTPSTPRTSAEFQGDIKESIPDMASLPACPQTILLMTEEEIAQAELIEDIFLMLHDLQPGYLHPAHRPQANVVRASMIKRFATQISMSRARSRRST